MTLLPCIVGKIPKFVQHLDILAETGHDFSLVGLGTNLAFDIIGAVVMGVDFEAQPDDASQQGELVRLYVELYSTFWNEAANFPWWMIPKTAMRRRRLGQRINVLLDDMIHSKYAEHKALGGDQSRSILSLSLQDATDLTPELLNETRDQIKTFLLAGHDTSSITLAWAFYWLSRSPRALRAVREELDGLLGTESDPETVYAKLLSPEGPDLVRRMAYISAVIKEILRLHPPAATARYVKPGTGFTVRTPDGNDYCLDDMIIYNCESLIQRDPNVYGKSHNYFNPERWLGDADHSGIPAGAWRPFERGPRNCIGQDFAMIELRVIIAAVARRYDFVKVGLGELSLDAQGQPTLDENGILIAKSDLYSVSTYLPIMFAWYAFRFTRCNALTWFRLDTTGQRQASGWHDDESRNSIKRATLTPIAVYKRMSKSRMRLHLAHIPLNVVHTTGSLDKINDWALANLPQTCVPKLWL